MAKKEENKVTLVVKKIERKDYPWGVWSEEDQTFIKMYQTEDEAKSGINEILKEIEDAEKLLEDEAK